MRKISLVVLSAILLSSCVSKKKYVALETENGQLKSELTKTKVENEELEAKFDAIQARVDAYNNKINSLTEESNAKMVNVDGVVMSEDAKAQMRETLKNVPSEYLAGATTLKDSMNAAITYNIKNTASDIDESDDIAVKVEETVVMISISDKMLFKSGSYRVTDKADAILQKIADVINSEESLDVMVEGHTDDKKMIESASVKDNWDLSVLRATSVVKRLQNNFEVAPEKLIAAGRSFYQPLVSNDTAENRAKNRRTRIVILPNIDKFFALMAANQ
ncbi:OmpA/MotB family protein [Aestuariibaculum marinum]|uniref:OmpA family protein n=1 Tax=Aestuariibaculum marinum TaxID=2683592 RepID=A0A8J6PTE0_9FLAO|nr:OmpA family protein [Aestuariibaculum marinum]MBD0822736.1 OmpA family protein [Aestuariibaculum marinum]